MGIWATQGTKYESFEHYKKEPEQAVTNFWRKNLTSTTTDTSLVPRGAVGQVSSKMTEIASTRALRQTSAPPALRVHALHLHHLDAHLTKPAPVSLATLKHVPPAGTTRWVTCWRDGPDHRDLDGPVRATRPCSGRSTRRDAVHGVVAPISRSCQPLSRRIFFGLFVCLEERRGRGGLACVSGGVSLANFWAGSGPKIISGPPRIINQSFGVSLGPGRSGPRKRKRVRAPPPPPAKPALTDRLPAPLTHLTRVPGQPPPPPPHRAQARGTGSCTGFPCRTPRRSPP